MNDDIYTTSGQGQITQGLSIAQSVESIIAFVREELPRWRDDPNRSTREAENTLNSELCIHLNSRARHSLPMICFHHQPEEEDNVSRHPDLSANPAESRWFSGASYSRYYSTYKPLVVFEGKRLPTPSSNREHEYITGLTKVTGGIQRFKLGVHGAQNQMAVLIGYVQGETLNFWHQQINGWICQLAEGTLSDGQNWNTTEQLKNFKENVETKVANSVSNHSRASSGVGDSIELHHLWVLMINSRIKVDD